MDKKYKGLINNLGEFQDKDLEMEFFKQDMNSALLCIKPFILLLGILNVLFILPDYFLNPDRMGFLTITIIRALYFLLILVFLSRLKIFTNFRRLALVVSLFEAAGVLIFLFSYYQNDTYDFLIQVLGVIVVIIAIFQVPNRWLNRILVACIVTLTFIGLSFISIRNIDSYQFSSGVIYLLIVTLLCSVFSYRDHYYKRIQFLNEKNLIKLSVTDRLTGIYNRSKFDDELMKVEAFSKRYGTAFSLILFDFDDFKIINDSHGHMIGDQVIVTSTQIISSMVRETDIFARWGGEEFVILLPNTEIQDAVDLSERLRKAIENHHFEGVGRVTCSFGVIRLSAEDPVENFMTRADKMLYMAKRAGKNRVMS